MVGPVGLEPTTRGLKERPSEHSLAPPGGLTSADRPASALLHHWSTPFRVTMMSRTLTAPYSVGTRSLSKRHPRPFLIPAQLDRLYALSRAILTEAGYVGARTCEFLVGLDGTISFLAINTQCRSSTPCRTRCQSHGTVMLCALAAD